VILNSRLLPIWPVIRHICLFAVLSTFSGHAVTDTSQTAHRFYDSVVDIYAKVPPEARTANSLGQERAGTGVVIDGGYILTIGYLVIEASEIKIGVSNGQTIPGTLVGYDHTTGFGILKSVVPAPLTALTLGDSGKIQVDERLLILPSPQQGLSSLAQMVSRRPFAGWWEYYLEDPIYTFPTNQAWAGAPLLNSEGEILGIGSLFVADAVSQGVMSPGNLFVPINLLKPILADLTEFGRRTTNIKPYLGLSSDDSSGQVIITRVNKGSPSAKVGILAQDIITHVNQTPVTTLKEFYEAVWGSGESGSIVSLGITRAGQEISVRVQTVDRMDYFVKPRSY